MARSSRSLGPVVGLDLGGTKIYAVAVSPRNKILGRYRVKTAGAEGAEAVIDRMAECVKGAMSEAGVGAGEVSCVGAAVPGPVIPGTGTVIFAPNLGWENLPVGDILSRKLKLPVVLGNDVNLGTWGEFVLGAGRGASSLLGVFWGTGVGGGIVIDGRLLRGRNGTGAEIGHTTVRVGGRKCGCGRRGCMEAYAGRLAIAKYIKRSISKGKSSLITDFHDGGLERVATGAMRRSLVRGDKVVRKAVRKAARYLGDGVGSAINLIGPDRVIIGGGVSELLAVDDDLWSYLVARIKKRAVPHSMKDVDIVLAELGDDAVALGAAALARAEMPRARRKTRRKKTKAASRK